MLLPALPGRFWCSMRHVVLMLFISGTAAPSAAACPSTHSWLCAAQERHKCVFDAALVLRLTLPAVLFPCLLWCFSLQPPHKK